MRTSNKILLGVFLGVVMVLTIIHVSLYAKYKSGDFTTIKETWKQHFVRHDLKKINNIVVTGLNNFSIIPADTLRLEIEKNDQSHIRFQVAGDSLVIHGDTVVSQPGEERKVTRSYQSVNLFLPGAGKIIADNCELWLKGAEDMNKAQSYQLVLTNESHFHLNENDWQDSTWRYYGKLSIQAGTSSSIELANYARIAEMGLLMQESSFDDKEAQIEKLIIDADKKSSVVIKGDNLKRLNIIQQH